jgi:hypothetical protein
MASIDREQVAADWAKRGFSCDLWIDPPGRRWEDFTHATDELVVVLEGEMEFEIAGPSLSPCDRRRASDPCWCHSFGTQHRSDHRPLALRLQTIRM